MLRTLIALPLLLLLTLFALSNAQNVRLVLWPTDLSVEAPLSLTVLAGMGLAFLVGALVLWFGTIGARLRARRAEQTVHLLEAQIAELKAELNGMRRSSPTVAPPSRQVTWRG